MKRSVAVTGPTPAFIRWAILKDCSLRDVEVEDLPDATFRQLRSIAELSVASRQHRIFENVCVAADADSQRPEEARGFPVAEILDMYGSADRLEQVCGECEANCWPTQFVGLSKHPGDHAGEFSTRPLHRLAGCFGMLATDLNWSFDPSHAASGQTGSREDAGGDLIAMTQRAAADQPDLLGTEFPDAVHPFYRLWQTPVWSPQQAGSAGQLFAAIDSPSRGHDEIKKLIVACEQCSRHDLTLHVELVPSGYSDGLHWRRAPCCSRCRFVHDPPRRPNAPCRGCGGRDSDLYVGKSKVLGRRPYLLLEKIFGRESTAAFLRRYQQHRLS